MLFQVMGSKFKILKLNFCDVITLALSARRPISLHTKIIMLYVKLFVYLSYLTREHSFFLYLSI